MPIVSDRLAGDRVLGGYEQLLDAYVAYAGFPVERQIRRPTSCPSLAAALAAGHEVQR